MALPPPQAAAPPSEVPVPLPPAVPNLQLIGIIAGADQPLALVRRAGTATIITLRPGDLIEEWLIVTIDPEQLLLKQGTREQVFTIFERKTAAGDRPVAQGRSPAIR
jgi:hypothetical protein